MEIEAVERSIGANKKVWLITGVSGFIGSHLLEKLLLLGQTVIGIDDFSTGRRSNLSAVRAKVGDKINKNFTFLEADICDYESIKDAFTNVDYVLHQAALGSVPRSIKDPIRTNDVNISGFLNVLTLARDFGVSSFTYAASSSTYGDHPDLPKKEETIGNPLSPYAVTKYVNELYAEVFSRAYGFNSIGLRYFNVFGPRQNPHGGYAAVIPKWIESMLSGNSVFINGDGLNSRDFCYVENVVQANLLAAIATESAKNQVYNVAVGDNTSLNELFKLLRAQLAANGVHYLEDPIHKESRPGDVKHSMASIEKIKRALNYSPAFDVHQGLSRTVAHYASLYKSDEVQF